MSIAMTTEEREVFLADVHVGVLSVAHPTGGPPVSAPIWYGYEGGGTVRFITGGDSPKGRALRAAGAASLCVQSEEAPYKYVTVEGSVAIEEGTDPEERKTLAYRYLGPEFGDLYLQSTSDEGSITVTLSPEAWHTSDFAKSLG